MTSETMPNQPLADEPVPTDSVPDESAPHEPAPHDGHRRHRPGPGRPVPVSTYRLQIHSGFTYRDAARQVPYLAALGVTHAYLSPILQSAPGSAHGYDVLDHTRINRDAGGYLAFEELVEASTSSPTT